MKNQLIIFVFLLIVASFTSCHKKETIVDVDGNVYHTIKIGTQVWTKENLMVTHYRNGDAIPNVTDSAEWINLKTGAFCNYNNDSTIARIYGRLYNWYSVIDKRNIAPEGWHVPTDADWTILENYLGSDSAGGKMKEKGTNHWKAPNNGATNKSELEILPGGYRYYGDGSFNDLGELGRFWSLTEINDSMARPRNFSNTKIKTYRFITGKASGFSIRLIKDGL